MTSATRGNPTLRFIDRYVGIPIVAALGLRPKRPFDPAATHRIGVMRTVALGDTIMLAGILHDLRRQFPRSTIVLITGEDNRGVGELMVTPGDEHLVISPRRPLSALRAVRAARLDVLVDCGVWVRFDAVISALSGARFTVGLRTAGQGRHFAYDRSVDHLDSVHEVDNYRRIVELIGVKSTTVPRIPAPRALPTAKLPPRPFVVFHAWPSGLRPELKEWPNAEWTNLAKHLIAKGWTIVLTGGSADRDRSRGLANAIRSIGVEPVDTSGQLTIAELADVLVASAMVVSVNTGVMHLAAAVGARTVGLQGPTSSRRWGPLGPNSRAVDSTLSGCGYLNLGWEYAGHRSDCMRGVSVDAVVRAVEELVVPSHLL
jgi:heptosyltransferase I